MWVNQARRFLQDEISVNKLFKITAIQNQQLLGKNCDTDEYCSQKKGKANTKTVPTKQST